MLLHIAVAAEETDKVLSKPDGVAHHLDHQVDCNLLTFKLLFQTDIFRSYCIKTEQLNGLQDGGCRLDFYHLAQNLLPALSSILKPKIASHPESIAQDKSRLAPWSAEFSYFERTDLHRLRGHDMECACETKDLSVSRFNYLFSLRIMRCPPEWCSSMLVRQNFTVFFSNSLSPRPM